MIGMVAPIPRLVKANQFNDIDLSPSRCHQLVAAILCQNCYGHIYYSTSPRLITHSISLSCKPVLSCPYLKIKQSKQSST